MLYRRKGNPPSSPKYLYKLKSNIIFHRQSINFFSIDKVICEIRQALFLSETFHLFASFATRLYYMVSIILIESSCSELYMKILVARWKNAVHYFSLQLPAPIHLPQHLVKNTADYRSKENFLAIMLRSTDRSSSWTQVPEKIFKRVREVDLRTSWYKVRSSTKLFSSKFFLSFLEYFYLPLSYAQKWD